MSDILVTVTIDRTSLGKTALTYSATPGVGTIGISAYQPPSKVRRVTYADDHPNMDGSVALSSSVQQAILGWNIVTDGAADEAAVAAAIAELDEALGQFPAYPVTTQVGNAPAEVWSADPGTVALAASGGRTFTDLRDTNPEYVVTIPVYPNPGSVT